MGCTKLLEFSSAEIGKRIRTLSEDSANVILRDHTQEMMDERGITFQEVLSVLRKGAIRREPEISEDGESLECRMERYFAGRDIGVIAAIDDETPNVVVVTTFAD